MIFAGQALSDASKTTWRRAVHMVTTFLSKHAAIASSVPSTSTIQKFPAIVVITRLSQRPARDPQTMPLLELPVSSARMMSRMALLHKAWTRALGCLKEPQMLTPYAIMASLAAWAMRVRRARTTSGNRPCVLSHQSASSTTTPCNAG
jgi:hypothetical protein